MVDFTLLFKRGTFTLLTAAEGTSAEAIVLPNDDMQDMLLEFKLNGTGETGNAQ